MSTAQKKPAPTFIMHDVKSSLISSIGHHDDVLQVKFQSGAVYSYPGVTAAEFDKLRKAESVGKAFGHIRTNFKGTLVK